VAHGFKKTRTIALPGQEKFGDVASRLGVTQCVKARGYYYTHELSE